MLKRAYSQFEIKATGTNAAGRRTFTGIATTPTTDRMGDIIDPRGAVFSLPLAFLWQHDSMDPIGWITAARVSTKGIEVDGEVADVAEDGPLKTRLLSAWQMIKGRIVRGLSVGFRPIDSVPINPKEPWGASKFLKWEWLELSAVTIAANQEASITAIKSIDERFRAASGQRKPGVSNPPASGTARQPIKPNGATMKTYTQESLTQLQDARATNAKRMAELNELKSAESRQFTDEERAEFNGLDATIEDQDDDIKVAQRHLSNISRAVPVEGGRSAAPYGYAKKFKDVEEKFKGETGLKRLMCQLQSSIDIKSGTGFMKPSELAERRFGKTNPTLVAIMKANEVAGGGTESGEPFAELADVDNRYTGDFIEFLYGATVFDQLPLRSVPHNVAIKGQDGAFTGYWIGQSKAIKMSQGSASSVSTAPLKVAGLTVMSNELIRDSSPSALAIAGEGLREALSQVVDTKFFSADAVSSGISPAGMLNGISAISSNGGDADSIRTDIKALFAPFIAAKNATGFVWVMTPTTALALSLMQNALGQLAFPGVTPTGGTFHGFPVYVGNNIGTGDVILLQPKEIWKIGDLGVQISTSTEAMIEQSTAPTGATDTPVAASQYMTSMFQEDSTAIKVVRPINFGKRRTNAGVAYIGDAAWGSENS